jgi:hypothetical protein
MFIKARTHSSISRIERMISGKQFVDLSKALCANEIGSDSEWSSVINSTLKLVETNKADKSAASIVPSLVIASAVRGYSLSQQQGTRVGELALAMFSSLSDFDKVVFTIGCSQASLRRPEVVDFVNRFLTEAREPNQFGGIPQRFLPGFLLAVSNLGIDNQLSWNLLLAKIDIENLNSHDLTQAALAIATARAFPIASIERIIESAAQKGGDAFSVDDSVCLAHSLTCLEVFHVDLFRSLLVRISNAPSLDEGGQKLLKQIILSMFLDEKARAIPESLSPVVLEKLDKFLDWSVPEPQRHHGMVSGEIQQILSESELGYLLSEERINQPLAVCSLSNWTPAIAASVAIDRFYVSDIPCAKFFFHIDDETYPDISEGPLDPFLQVKHLHVKQCGLKVVWVRELEWSELTFDEKVEFLKKFIQK